MRAAPTAVAWLEKMDVVGEGGGLLCGTAKLPRVCYREGGKYSTRTQQ